MTEPGANLPAHGVAIIGMAGRFPGAHSLEELWQHLRDGVESISFFSEEELIESGIEPEVVRQPGYVRAKGVAEGIELFEPAFFGFTPREAELMDPQHRILLECAWEALEDAGCDPGRFEGRAAVYVGSGMSSYLLSNLLPNRTELEKAGSLQVLLLNDRDFAATRLSYKLGLRGPSAVVQTACSTSLMAVHMACQSLLTGESDLAVAGGVSLSVPLKEGYVYQEGSIASPDGHCRSFDAAAGGSVPGNGAGIVVLKRLADAMEAGDAIHAVILGSAANNDGSAKVGFTAPSIEGQAEVIAEGLLMAGIEVDSLAYVEGHGSATALGDPIEVAALRQAFERAGHGGRPVALGSVKSNLGHLNTAAGIAGLIKAVLALRYGTIPPSLHFQRPNPQTGFGPFYVPTEALPWPEHLSPRRAGVSSFGLGGTNVHLVLEEAPQREPAGASRPWQLLALSARTPTALDSQAARLADRLEAGGLDLADVAYTLQTGRKEFAHRRAMVCSGGADAVAALRQGLGASGWFAGSERPVVFLFPGLGDHYLDMGHELYAAEPVFAAEVDRCAELLRPHLGIDVREVLFAAGARIVARAAGGEWRRDLRAMLRRGGQDRDEASRRLDRTERAQPILFTIEFALARLLMAWGIRPQAMIGYSLGEYVAACLAGALSLTDALALVARRARLIEQLPAGAMLAVPLPEAEVRPYLDERLAVAATNGPHFCVAGGPEEAIAELDRRLAERGVACLRLTTTHAFHTPLMKPAVAALTELAHTVPVREPEIPYLSNVTGTWITGAELQDPGYWARHMVQPVRFAEGIAELLRDPDRAMIEVGPGGTLSALVRQHPEAGSARTVVATMRRESDEASDLAVLLDALGRLWCAGASLDPKGLFAGQRRQRVPLPTYPFERQRCWIEPPAGVAQPLSVTARAADLADWFWVPAWRQVPRQPPATTTPERWLVFLDRGGLGERIAARLRQDGNEVSTAVPGIAFQALGEGAFVIDPARRQDYDALLHGEVPGKVLHLWGTTAGEPSFEEAQTSGLVSLTLLAQAISAVGGDAPVRLGWVANGLHEVADGDPIHPGKSTILGALKVVRQEVPRLDCGSIEIVPPAPGSPQEERLVDQLLAEMAGPAEPTVALRGRQRWVRGFEPVRLPEGAGSRLLPGGAYLIAGAEHGPGMAIAEHLVRSLDARIGLVLPPQLPPRESWETWKGLPEVPPGQDVLGAAILRLLALEREAGLDRVLILRAQPGDGEGLRAALAATRGRFGPVHGVFFTGGPVAGGLIQLKTPEALHSALGSVARDAEALLAAVDAEPVPPAFVLLSSTTTAVAGSFGQLDRAAAGSYLDVLAARREAEGQPHTVVVHWDPYQWGGWLVAGVAGGMSGLAPEEVAASLEANSVTEERSAGALQRLLASPLSRVIVSGRDLSGLIAETDSVTADMLLAQMAPAHAGEKAPRPVLMTPFVPPRDEVEGRLAAIWHDLFGIEPIGRDDSFLELGGHSLLAIQIVTQVRTALEADLPVTALFEAPTIAQLAKAVRRARGEEDAEELETLLALVEGLSATEAAERLAELAPR